MPYLPPGKHIGMATVETARAPAGTDGSPRVGGTGACAQNKAESAALRGIIAIAEEEGQELRRFGLRPPAALGHRNIAGITSPLLPQSVFEIGLSISEPRPGVRWQGRGRSRYRSSCIGSSENAASGRLGVASRNDNLKHALSNVAGRRLELLPPEQIGFLTGATLLAALVIIEWPVAVVLAVGHTLAYRSRRAGPRNPGTALERG